MATKKLFSFCFFIVASVLFFSCSPSRSSSGGSSSSNNVQLKITFVFKGIEDGYDHQNKTKVTIGGNTYETSVQKESQPNTITITTTRGNHTLEIMNYALYKGNWEAHTKANDYSIDCSYTGNIDLTKAVTEMKLVFDLDKGTSVEYIR